MRKKTRHLYWLFLKMHQIPQQVGLAASNPTFTAVLLTVNEGKELGQVGGDHKALLY